MRGKGNDIMANESKWLTAIGGIVAAKMGKKE